MLGNKGSIFLLMHDPRFAEAKTLVISLMFQKNEVRPGWSDEQILDAWMLKYCKAEKQRVWSYLCKAGIDKDTEALVRLRTYMRMSPFREHLTTDYL